MKNPTTRHLKKAHNSARKALVIGVRTALLLGFSHGLYAAPGTLSDKPLFLSTNIQPNIFFMVDDSGSMDWEVLLSKDARAAHPTAPDSGTLNFQPRSAAEERELCYAYNAMAYNPNRSYTPWRGVDSAGAAYGDMTLAAARNNPYSATGSTTNLSSHFYFPWNDDGDWVYESGECPTPQGAATTPLQVRSAPLLAAAYWFHHLVPPRRQTMPTGSAITGNANLWRNAHYRRS